MSEAIGDGTAHHEAPSEWQGLVQGARDALTDEMVGRVSATLAESLDLLDRINRSGIGQALPALGVLVANGDVERLVHLARVAGAVQDALSEEMVGRLAGLWSEALVLVDRLTRSGALLQILALLEREEVQQSVVRLLGALTHALEEQDGKPAPRGGIGGFLQVMKRPETQAALQLLGSAAQHLRDAPR
ncbi:MAG: hypothetical protein B7Z66_08380 [Chromatiales bacterium 21-64-14]|nr:MAG: hypothetical protein B7Z66_08380 [Chromatiales bacterium 21-64-14]HQU15352.1 hypothetical protein [Gammaproteobacteria bacterium]